MPNETRAQGQRSLVAGRISAAAFHRMRASGRGHLFGDPTSEEYTNELRRGVEEHLAQTQRNQGVHTRLRTPLLHAALDAHHPGHSEAYERHETERHERQRAADSARVEASPEWRAIQARQSARALEARVPARPAPAPQVDVQATNERAARIRAQETARRAEADARKAERAGNHAEAARLHREIAAAHRMSGDHSAALYADSQADAAEHRGRMSNPLIATATMAQRKADYERTPEAHRAAAAAHSAAGNHAEAQRNIARADELHRRRSPQPAPAPKPSVRPPEQPHALKKGKKGGSFYVSDTGRKVYVKT